MIGIPSTTIAARMFSVLYEKHRSVKVKWHYDALPGNVERDDISGEARALLSDKRDTITSVFVFSVTEAQHVTTYKRRDFGLVE